MALKIFQDGQWKYAATGETAGPQLPQLDLPPFASPYDDEQAWVDECEVRNPGQRSRCQNYWNNYNPFGPPVEEDVDRFELDFAEGEVKTQAVWVNGDPIFQRTRSFGLLPAGNWDVAHDISGLSRLIRMDGSFARTANKHPFQFADGTAQINWANCYLTNTNLFGRAGEIGSDFVVTLWYTRSGQTATPPVYQFKSTEEFTGELWTNGHPIFQKSVDFNTAGGSYDGFPQNDTTTRPHGIADMNVLVEAWGGGSNAASTEHTTFPYFNHNNANTGIGYSVSNTNISVDTGSQASGPAYTFVWFTLKYTKTGVTSPPGPVWFQHKTTEEPTGLHWIGGAPIYQTTYTVPALAASTPVPIAHQISGGLGRLIRGRGVVTSGSNHFVIPHAPGLSVPAAIGFHVDATNIVVTPGTVAAPGGGHITIEYTKA